MLKKSFCILIALFLASCATAPIANTSTPNLPTSIFTPLPSSTATPIPVTPTATLDPNMPPDATGKDAQGNYIKVENGVTYTWKNVQYGDTPDASVQLWERIGTVDPNGTVMFDYGSQRLIPTRIYFNDSSQVSIQKIYIDHPANAPQNGITFSIIFYNNLAKFLEIPHQKFPDFWSNLTQGNLHIQFTTQDGVTHDWNPGPNKGYVFYQVPWEKADPDKYINFQQVGDWDDPKVQYRYGVTSKDDAIIGLGAVQDMSILTDKQLIQLILAPLLEVATHANGAMPTLKIAPHFEPTVVNLANFAGEEEESYIHFTVVKK